MSDSTPQTGLKEELAQAIEEMNARTDSFSEAEVFDKLRNILGNKQVSKGYFALYQGESDAFIFSPRRKEDAPFPGYFQPMMWVPRVRRLYCIQSRSGDAHTIDARAVA